MELLCLDFVNSVFRDFRGRWARDDLLRPEWFEQFLDKWHLRVEQRVDEDILKELIALRALLTRIIEGLESRSEIDEQDLAALNVLLRKTTFNYQAEQIDQELHLASVPVKQDWNWVQNEIITDFITLLVDYDQLRLKVCQNPNCRWIFYDETKSRTRRYCSTDKCANLMKLRRFRARQKRVHE